MLNLKKLAVAFFATVMVAVLAGCTTSNALVGEWKADESPAGTTETLVTFTSDDLTLVVRVEEGEMKLEAKIMANYTIDEQDGNVYLIKISDVKVEVTGENIEEELKTAVADELKTTFEDESKVYKYEVSDDKNKLTEYGESGNAELTYSKVN